MSEERFKKIRHILAVLFDPTECPVCDNPEIFRSVLPIILERFGIDVGSFVKRLNEFISKGDEIREFVSYHNEQLLISGGGCHVEHKHIMHAIETELKIP